MKKYLALAQAGLIAAGCAGFSGAAQAARPELPMFGMHAFLGGKFLKKDDWEPAEDQFAYGGGLDFQPHGWPIAFTAEYLGGNGSGDVSSLGKVKSTTTEYRAGLKYFWQTGRIGRAFAGGGVSFAHAKAEVPSANGTADGDGTGGWIGGGYLFELGPNFDLGVQASYSFVKLDLTGPGGTVNVEAGGASFGGVAGFRF